MADYRLAGARLEQIFAPPAKYLRLLLVLVALAVLFAVLAELVETGAPLPIDLSVIHVVQSWRNGWLDTLMRSLTDFGYQPWVLTPPLILLVGLVIVREGASVAALMVALLGCLGNPLLKIAVHRPRPGADYAIGSRVPKDYSFPSGHAATAMIIFGLFIYLACVHLSERRASRNVIIIICTLLILGIGLSRIYLGEHWFSDVIGGYAFGLGWLMLVIIVHQALSTRRRTDGTGAIIATN